MRFQTLANIGAAVAAELAELGPADNLSTARSRAALVSAHAARTLDALALVAARMSPSAGAALLDELAELARRDVARAAERLVQLARVGELEARQLADLGWTCAAERAQLAAKRAATAADELRAALS